MRASPDRWPARAASIRARLLPMFARLLPTFAWLLPIRAREQASRARLLSMFARLLSMFAWPLPIRAREPSSRAARSPNPSLGGLTLYRRFGQGRGRLFLLEAREVRDAVGGARSGASRNLRRDVRASDRVVDSCLQAARGHRFQMGCSQRRARGRIGEGPRFYIALTLDVLARDVRFGVRSRR